MRPQQDMFHLKLFIGKVMSVYVVEPLERCVRDVPNLQMAKLLFRLKLYQIFCIIIVYNAVLWYVKLI